MTEPTPIKKTYLQLTRDSDCAAAMAAIIHTQGIAVPEGGILITPSTCERALRLAFAMGAQAAWTTMSVGHNLQTLQEHIVQLYRDASSSTTQKPDERVRTSADLIATDLIEPVRTDLIQTEASAATVGPVVDVDVPAAGPDGDSRRERSDRLSPHGQQRQRAQQRLRQSER